jgi:voltage-gated potassium channel
VSAQDAPKDSFRRRVYLALEGGHVGGSAGLVIEVGLVTLIVLNVLAYVLVTVPAYRHEFSPFFRDFEIFSVAVFTIEYLLRIWTSVEEPSAGERGPLLGRLYFATRPMMVIDFLAIAPAYVAIFVPFIDLRALRLFRLIRLLKIARYSPALSTLARVISEERRALFGCLLLFLCAMLFAAATMHAIEGTTQPDKFGTIPDSLWWAVTTLTTVGYGDSIPHTALGRFVAGITMLMGLGLAALPVGIVATGFAHSIHRRDFVITFGMIAKVPIFQGFDAQTVSELMAMLRAQAVNAGDLISVPGERAAAMYFVVAGEIEAQLPSQKLRFGAGEYFGELALLHETMREATIIAVASTRLLALSAHDFEGLMRKRPDLKERMQKVAAQQTQRAEGAFSENEIKAATKIIEDGE